MNCLPQAGLPPGEYLADITVTAAQVSVGCIRKVGWANFAWWEWLIMALIAFTVAFVLRRRGEIAAPSLPGISGREDFGREDEE